MNALRNYSGRLTGAAQTASLRLEAGGAERLYEELVRPYQRPDRPVPAMLALHFHDLARLRQRDNIKRFGLSYLALQSFGGSAPEAALKAAS